MYHHIHVHADHLDQCVYLLVPQICTCISLHNMYSVSKVIVIDLILLVNRHDIVCMFVTEFVIDAEEEKHIAAVQLSLIHI